MFDELAQMFAYGQPDARMWLIGLEEHCEDARDLAERIAIRGQPTEYFDLEAFHRQLAQGMPEIQRVPVWRNALEIYKGVYGRPTLLGRLDPAMSDLLLAEILPFPRPQNNQWPEVFHAAFRAPADYLAFALPLMSARLVNKVALHGPELVILHGKGSHDRWLRGHPTMGGGWTKVRYGERANETLKWRLHEGTLWLRTNNLVNNGRVDWKAPQIAAVVELIDRCRAPRL